jgi:peptide/nickel transport system ATP-binding protein
LGNQSEQKRKDYAWKKISVVFQNRLEVLNPVLTLWEQIHEILKEHTDLKRRERKEKIEKICHQVDLSPQWLKYYPHQISGGMRQKFLIAMALVCYPEILIVDEPTSALDPRSRKELIALLQKLKETKDMTMLLITHDMILAQSLATRLGVLYSGYLLEEGYTKEVIRRPMHTYTRGLLQASPDINPYKDLWGIPSSLRASQEEGCSFYARCNQSKATCLESIPRLEDISLERKVACHRGGIVKILEGINIHKAFQSNDKKIEACKGCYMEVQSGEIVALVGRSGSGKSTLSKVLAGFLPLDEGRVSFEGESIQGYEGIRRQGGIQMVFQDPYASTNPNFTVEEVIVEPIKLLKIGTEKERNEKVQEALTAVQLPIHSGFKAKKCSNLSGGQRQRVALARSLVLDPKVLIADEICSMLDPSTKANILRLLKGLQNKKGFSMLYITHDLSIARKIADQIYVMHQGEIIEKGTTFEVLQNPQCQDTQKLIKDGIEHHINII